VFSNPENNTVMKLFEFHPLQVSSPSTRNKVNGIPLRHSRIAMKIRTDNIINLIFVNKGNKPITPVNAFNLVIVSNLWGNMHKKKSPLTETTFFL